MIATSLSVLYAVPTRCSDLVSVLVAAPKRSGVLHMPFDPTTESEWQTRKPRIDGALADAGWKVRLWREQLGSLDHDAIEEHPAGNGFADYALYSTDRPLGVVEAKKVTLGPQNALTQAQRYSRDFADSPFQFGQYRVPFLYSTNGEVVWFQELRHALNRSRRIAKFHTPAALEEMFGRDFDTAWHWFAATKNNHPHLRPYQIEANAAIKQVNSANSNTRTDILR